MWALLMIEVIKYIIFVFHLFKCSQGLICVCNPPVQNKASHLLSGQRQLSSHCTQTDSVSQHVSPAAM